MTGIWLVATGVLVYAIWAAMMSPLAMQLRKEYDDAEAMYQSGNGPVARLGLLVNRLHFRIVSNQARSILVVAAIWMLATMSWIGSQ